VSRRKKLTLAAIGTIVALVLGVTVWVLVANDFKFHEERVTIQGPRGELHGVLARPAASSGPSGLVVFVHGDGPANASRDDAYKPLWDAFAKAGFASLSWDKPGVDGAPGDWLDQSMQDRAAEVDAAIAWAHTRDDIDTTRIGAWGVSQAGWVLPEVARARPDLRFMILVGPAINWLRQGEFNLRADLAAAGASPDRVASELGRRARQIQLLKAGADYATYRASGVDPDPMTAERWGFVSRNFRSDSTADIARISIPTLLILGGRDRNVDVAETERVYRATMPPNTLTVKDFPDGTHSMTRNDIEYNPDDLRAIGRTIFAPRSIYVPGYLDALRVFAKRQAG
jgi:pimeloyl-ACP methyl ester carboxylesterase